MKRLNVFLKIMILTCVIQPLFAQDKLDNLTDFIHPVGNWVKAEKLRQDSQKPEILTYESGNDCFVNGKNGSATYLVSKKEYQDIEFHVEFMIPKGSNSGIYFQCRYELQLFDSWGATDLTFYDCGGIQNRSDKVASKDDVGFNGYAPMVNACRAPGVWQSLDVMFRAPKFNEKGEKIKNASFEKVVLNGIVVQENAELSGPTRGALSEVEVTKAPFRLQGGHGPVAFRSIRVKELVRSIKSK